MITLSNLNKNNKEIWLPRLFDLLYENMNEIILSNSEYEQEKEQWFTNVTPALDKPTRQITMCFDDNELIGYIQYYINNKLLMIEELQLNKKYHCTFTFYSFCKNFIKGLPSDIKYIEAFADRRNSYSQKLIQKSGMKYVDSNSNFIHFRGDADKIINRFIK